MRISLAVCIALWMGLASADTVVLKSGAKVESVAEPKPVAKAQVQVAQDRQDDYSAPKAPVVDSYGPPQAPPVKDTYGSPAAPVEAPAAPVQGDVGTQGYYYYYYPVANSGGQQTYQSSSPSKTEGGLLGGSNLGIIIVLGLGVLVVFALIAATATSSTSRSFPSMDLDSILEGLAFAQQLYER